MTRRRPVFINSGGQSDGTVFWGLGGWWVDRVGGESVYRGDFFLFDHTRIWRRSAKLLSWIGRPDKKWFLITITAIYLAYNSDRCAVVRIPSLQIQNQTREPGKIPINTISKCLRHTKFQATHHTTFQNLGPKICSAATVPSADAKCSADTKRLRQLQRSSPSSTIVLPPYSSRLYLCSFLGISYVKPYSSKKREKIDTG